MTDQQVTQKKNFGRKRAGFGFGGLALLLLFPGEINSLLAALAAALNLNAEWLEVAYKLVGLGAVAYAFHMQSTDREVPKQ